MKFVNGLRPEIKQGIGYQKIRQFLVLVNKSRIFYEDSKARFTHYKNLSEKKGNGRFRGKPYVTPVDKGKQKATFDRRPSGGGMNFAPKCFKCGGVGHRESECRRDLRKCSNCGGVGHVVADCKRQVVKCYNCGEPGHISSRCPKPKQVQAGGRVFALAGAQPMNADRMIKGTCFISCIPCCYCYRC